MYVSVEANYTKQLIARTSMIFLLSDMEIVAPCFLEHLIPSCFLSICLLQLHIYSAQTYQHPHSHGTWSPLKGSHVLSPQHIFPLFYF
jgi:hypothetical protein